MRDVADQSQGAIDTFMEAALANARAQAQSRALTPCGFCHFCESEVRGQLLFCDIDCSQDFEAEQKVRRQRGLA